MDTTPAGLDHTVDYLSSKDAIAALAIKPETLYTYVGRGWIRRVPHPDGKHSLYSREDIERIRARSNARSGHAAVAASAMFWGEPVIETAITELTPAGPKYRGRLAVDLADSGHTFEAVSELLWTGDWTGRAPQWNCESPPFDPDRFSDAVQGFDPRTQPMAVLSMVILHYSICSREPLRRYERPAAQHDPFEAARRVIRTFCGCLGYLLPQGRFQAPLDGEPVAAHIARAMLCPPTEEALSAVNAILIISADHELSAATFAARTAASTGAEFFSCLGAALYAHAGGDIRGGCDDIEDMVTECNHVAAFRERIEYLNERALRVPGFNHPFYPKGDPRALYLFDIARALDPSNERLALILEFAKEAELRLQIYPSIALGLVALSYALGLPYRAAGMLWAIGWTAGWAAHIAEQHRAGYMFRPRAKYIKSIGMR